MTARVGGSLELSPVHDARPALVRRVGQLIASEGTDRHVPGEAGIWVFIFGDLSIFALLFATYLHYRAEDVAMFNASQLTLNQACGLVNTLLLLTSSALVVTGVRAIRARLRTLASWMFIGAFCCGLGFMVVKYFEYSDKISHGLTPATNHFYMYYFAMTGMHLFHLVIGMSVLAFLCFKARATELTERQMSYVEGGACFWHMVDLLWILLFPLLYFVR